MFLIAKIWKQRNTLNIKNSEAGNIIISVILIRKFLSKFYKPNVSFLINKLWKPNYMKELRGRLPFGNPDYTWKNKKHRKV